MMPKKKMKRSMKMKIAAGKYLVLKKIEIKEHFINTE